MKMREMRMKKRIRRIKDKEKDNEEKDNEEKDNEDKGLECLREQGRINLRYICFSRMQTCMWMCVCVCVPQMECWRGDTASFSVRLPHQQGVVRRAFANK